MPEMRQETVQLASGRRQIIHRGGDGPPLLWLHGIAGVEERDPLLQALQEEHAVVAPLAPGFNDLAELDDIADIHDLALHYDDVLAALGLHDITVVGHSFGAMIAAELAAHSPARVGRLVLISPVGLWNDAYPVADMFAVPYPELPAFLYADPSAAARLRPEGEGAQDTVDVEGLIEVARGMTSVAKFLWPIPDRGLKRRLYRIAAPTLVIFGEQDRFVPAAYADDFVAGLPSAESEIVPEAGHMVPVEATDVVRDRIERFLGAAVGG
jgi:pimeloyl-ACP methyl ester carboxylesterase